MSHFTVLVDVEDQYSSIDEIMEPFWDWYQIGGRWAYPFLVREDYEEPFNTELSWASDKNPPEAPEGYKWVSAAAKQDIEWDLMKEIDIKKQIERFEKLKKVFESNDATDIEPWVKITEEGISKWGEMLYYKDESLKDFLARQGLSESNKYNFIPYGFVADGQYVSKGDMGWWAISTNEKEVHTWIEEVQNYIEGLDNSRIIVLLDCHI